MPQNFQFTIFNSKSILNFKFQISNSREITRKGFTLVELLVVIAIIAVLAGISFVVFRGISAQGRDGTRIEDLTSIVRAIQIAEQDNSDPAKVLCFNTTAPCSGDSHPVGGNTKNTDGTGWVLVNFDAKNIATFNNLPVDPLNDGTYHYIYKSDGLNFEVDAVLESMTYKSKMGDDGGNDANMYEAGFGTKKI
jgi:prepilin-type N-terminal cleavage/methylation domain-containing protein